MAITVSSRPDSVSAAYLPMQYVMTSDKSPNTIAAEINQSINTISQVNAAINAIYGNIFEIGDTLILMVGTPTITVVSGDYVKIDGTGITQYDTIHRVKTVYDADTFTIDTGYTENAGSGSLDYYYKDFSIVLDVYVDSTFYVRLRTQVDSDGNFTFDISRHLQLFLGSSIETLGSATIAQATNTSKRFYVEYAEEYRVPDADGNPILETQAFTSDVANTKTVVNSAIQYVDYRNKSIVSTNYNMNDFTTAGSTRRWLTNAPSEIPIGTNDNYVLTLVEVIVAGTYKFRVDEYSNDGTLLLTTDYSHTPPSVYTAYNFPCGTDNITIGATTDYYECYLYNTSFSSQQTEKVRFTVDRKCYPNENRFEFVNSLGGMDGYTFKGQQSKRTAVARNEYKTILSVPRTIGEREYVTTQNIIVDTYITNSGRINLETAEWLQELFADTESYIVIDNNRLPIKIITSEMNVWDSARNSYNIAFEWQFAFDKKVQRN